MRIVSASGTDRVNRPSRPLVVPRAVPVILIVANSSGSLFSSVIRPEIFTAADIGKQQNNKIIIKMCDLYMGFIMIGLNSVSIYLTLSYLENYFRPPKTRFKEMFEIVFVYEAAYIDENTA